MDGSDGPALPAERLSLYPSQPCSQESPLNTGDPLADSEDNELFKEEQKALKETKPWWRANFFISEPVLFGAWDGVFTSCMLNIFGVIIFLRTGWMVGNAGIWYALLISLITLSVAFVSAFSGIGICDRCDIRGGGVFDLLQHVLGGQVAAAIGVVYCFGQAVSCSMNLMGFGESISILLHAGGGNNHTGDSHSGDSHSDDNPWIARGFALAASVLILGINLAGVKWVVRLQLILLLAVMVAVLDFLVGSFVQYQPELGVLRYSWALFVNNSHPDYQKGESFFSVFGVFFPTVCGVLSGINMAGDLRNPGKAIPVGTIAATGLSGIFYIMFIFVLGAVCQRWALQMDYMVAEKVSAVGALWLIGLYTSSISSCMGSMYSAPRILQSIANNNNFTKPFTYLGVGRGPNKVPIIALVIVSLITIIFICVGDVDFLAPIVTMPFLLTYVAVDYAHFSLAMTYDMRKAKLMLDSTVTSSARFQSNYGSMRIIDHSQSCNSELHRGNGIEKATECNSNESVDDLDQLFPERKLNKQVEESRETEKEYLADDQARESRTANGRLKLSASWYSVLCNKWISFIGVFGTVGIMFAINWLYSLICTAALVILYFYFGFAIPGTYPGITDFNFFTWMRTLCRGKREPRESLLIVNHHRPPLLAAPAQLNEQNEDFSLRKPYHQCEIKSADGLPLLSADGLDYR